MGKLVQLLRHIATMSEDQTKCMCNSRVCCGFVGWVTSCDDCLCKSRVAHEVNTEL